MNLSHTPSFRLFKKKLSFTDGVASLIDFSENQSRYHIDATEKEADMNALRSDWLAIGSDMKKAIEQYAAAEPR